MTPSPRADVREVLLQIVQEHQPRGLPDGSLQQGSILREAASRLMIVQDPELELAVLSIWNDLFRTGYLAWGMNLNNPDPPFFHITGRGKLALARLSRDPGNPIGYMQHLLANARLNPVAASYLTEALACFTGALYKAAAVMLGASAESLVLEIRDVTVERLSTEGIAQPKGLIDWRIKTVADSLAGLLTSRIKLMPHELQAEYEANWPAVVQQIRSTRNDAGHPLSVEPVTHDGVHASFLLFPELAKTATRLLDWIPVGFK